MAFLHDDFTRHYSTNTTSELKLVMKKWATGHEIPLHDSVYFCPSLVRMRVEATRAWPATNADVAENGHKQSLFSLLGSLYIT